MKKILAILLACAMVFAMAACANTDNSEKPDSGASKPPQGDVTTNPDNETTPGGNDATEPSEGFVWETKNVTLPTFAEVERLEFTVVEGKDAKARVIKSPWQFEDYNPEAAKTALQNSNLFKDWIFGTELKEWGNVTNYKDVGQMTGYEWEKNVVATRADEYYETMAYATDIDLTYSGNTETIHGYEGIQLEIDIPEENLTKEIQDEIYEILKVVYGQYAEAMCYAPIVEGENLIMEVKQANAIIYLRRGISEYGLNFNMYVKSLNSSYFKSFAGDGSYQSIAKAPQYAYEFLNENVGSLDVKDFKNIGANMLKDTFEGYVYTTPESTAYRVRYLTLENGHNVEEVEITGNIATEELSGSFAPDFHLEYEVVHNGTAITDVEMQFECGVGLAADGDDEYYEQLRAKFYGTAQKMFDYVLKEKVDISDKLVKGEDGDYPAYRFTTTVCGLEKSASLDFAMGPTMAGPVIGYIYYNIQ